MEDRAASSIQNSEFRIQKRGPELLFRVCFLTSEFGILNSADRVLALPAP